MSAVTFKSACQSINSQIYQLKMFVYPLLFLLRSITNNRLDGCTIDWKKKEKSPPIYYYYMSLERAGRPTVQQLESGWRLAGARVILHLTKKNWVEQTKKGCQQDKCPIGHSVVWVNLLTVFMDCYSYFIWTVIVHYGKNGRWYATILVE